MSSTFCEHATKLLHSIFTVQKYSEDPFGNNISCSELLCFTEVYIRDENQYICATASVIVVSSAAAHVHLACLPAVNGNSGR